MITLRRAFEIAEGTTVSTLYDIRVQLKREGYNYGFGSLDSAQVRNKLQSLISCKENKTIY